MLKDRLAVLFLASNVVFIGCATEAPGVKPDLPASSNTEDSDGEEDTEEEVDTDSSADEESDTESVFVPPPPDSAVAICDPWAQDCPDGQKCVPYSSTGSGVWDANHCVDIMGDDQVGDTCSYQGIASGEDSCGADSHCWDVMDVDGQLQGVCTPFCTGTVDNPICGPDTSCLIANEGAITLCIATCDPLLQECSEGLACFWANNDFNCIFTTDESPEGQPCGYINDCAPGNFCAAAEVLPACDDAACCAAFCDLSDPQCAVQGTECAPFFEEGVAAPGYEDVGVCIMPGS